MVRVYQVGLSSSTRVFRHWPESASQRRLRGELSKGVKCYRIPLHKPVHGTGNDQGPIQVKTDRSNGIRVGGKDFERFTWCSLSDTTVRSIASGSTSCDVPYPHCLIETARSKKVGFMIKVDAKHKVCVPLQNLDR